MFFAQRCLQDLFLFSFCVLFSFLPRAVWQNKPPVLGNSNRKKRSLEKIENKWLKLKNTFLHKQHIVLEGRNILIIHNSWMSLRQI